MHLIQASPGPLAVFGPFSFRAMFLQKDGEGSEVQRGRCQVGQAGSREEELEFLVDFFGD